MEDIFLFVSTFHHVYSNLVMLAKSKVLNKNVLDMNKHYLELKTFLSEAGSNPEMTMDRNVQVFLSDCMAMTKR